MLKFENLINHINEKNVCRIPFISFVVVYLGSLSLIIISSGVPLTRAEDDPSKIVSGVILSIIFLPIIVYLAGIPYLIIKRLCERLQEKGSSHREVTVKMLAMTIPNLLYTIYAMFLPGIHGAPGESGSGWAMVSGMMYFLNYPLLFIEWLFAKAVYDEYFAEGDNLSGSSNKSGE